MGDAKNSLVKTWPCPNCGAIFIDQQAMKHHAITTCGSRVSNAREAVVTILRDVAETAETPAIRRLARKHLRRVEREGCDQCEAVVAARNAVTTTEHWRQAESGSER